MMVIAAIAVFHKTGEVDPNLTHLHNLKACFLLLSTASLRMIEVWSDFGAAME